MASVTKSNPELANTSRSFLGKTIHGFLIDFGVNCSAELGPNEAVQIVLSTISKYCTIVGHSAVRADAGANAGQAMDVYIEGEFGTDTYDGTNSETFAVFLTSEIVALGATVGDNGIDLTGAAMTAISGFPLYANSPV